MACRDRRLARVRHELYSCSTSIRKTSEAKNDDTRSSYGDPPRKYVVDGANAKAFKVSEFDQVQLKWYPAEKGKNHPCSVDAVHMDDSGKWYAIEFKIGSVKTANLVRKIHETVMGMKEHLGPIDVRFSGYDFYRENMVYLVVASELEEMNSAEKTFYRAYNAYEEPWEQQNFPLRWQLKPLEGILVRKVYELSPSMFSRFAKKKKWFKK